MNRLNRGVNNVQFQLDMSGYKLFGLGVLFGIGMFLFSGMLFAAYPVNEWLLDEGVDTIVYDSGSAGNDGILMEGTASSVHGPEWVTDSQRGTVLSFDGTTDYILTDSDGVLGDSPRTVTCWFYLSADQNRHTLVEWGDGTFDGQYFRLLIEDNRLRLEVAGGNSLALDADALSLNTWYHVALVLDDFNGDGNVATFDAKFYLNGVEVPRAAFAGRALDTAQNGDDWVRLGGGADFDGSGVPREPLNGMLDNVRIYDTALSGAEILEDVGEGVEPPLLADEWLLDEGTGATVYDTGDGANEGTLMEGTTSAVNGPEWVTDSERGTVLAFDGDDWILTDSQGVLGSNARTVTAWFNLSADQYRHTLIEWGNPSSSGQYFRFVIENNQLRVEVSGGNALALDSEYLSENQWYHVAVVVDDFNDDGQTRTPETKFYLNGVEVPQTGGADQLYNTAFVDNDWVRLGGGDGYSGSDTPREALNGMLDDVRIYQTALTQAQINEDMNQLTAWMPTPAIGANVPVSTESLSWMPGSYVDSHQIYFGTNEEDVNLATPADPRGVYLDAAQIISPQPDDPTGRYSILLEDEGISLAPETTYYWRVDEINPAYSESPWEGSVWSFITNPFDASVQNLMRSGSLPDLVLSWDPPVDLKSPLYDVVIAEDADFQQIVSQVTGLGDTSWAVDTNAMLFETEYYCRVDAYDSTDPSICGPSEIQPLYFEAEGAVVIEDFDAYIEDGELLAVWQDGTTNSTGSTISLNYEADGQSMKLVYNNQSSPYLSVVERSFSSSQDWQAWGTEVLQLSFRADLNNTAASMYVELEDADLQTAKIYYDSPDDLIPAEWAEWTLWRINMDDVLEMGVDMSRITSLKIGIENSPSMPGSGLVSIDRIYLDVARCLPEFTDPADVNQDCSLGLNDLQLIAENWLASGYSVQAAFIEPIDYILCYPMDETSGSIVHDQSSNLCHAIVQAADPNVIWDSDGYSAGCINFDGNASVVLPDGVFDGIDTAFTITFWVDFDDDDDLSKHCVDFSSGLQGATEWDNVEYSYTGPITGWHHLCVTKDAAAGIARIYWDGVMMIENLLADIPINGSAIGNSYLGTAVNGEYGFMTGRMDEFRIYGRALTHEEVVYLSQGPSGSMTQPLVPVVCPFDPVQDNRINLIDLKELAASWLDDEMY